MSCFPADEILISRYSIPVSETGKAEDKKRKGIISNYDYAFAIFMTGNLKDYFSSSAGLFSAAPPDNAFLMAFSLLARRSFRLALIMLSTRFDVLDL